MPPTIRRQEPPKPNHQPVADPGSILSTCVPVTNLKPGFVKLCIYGRNRSGKTTLAAQAAKKHGPVLYISSEPDANGGADSIANVEGVYLQRVAHKYLGQDKDGRWVDAEDSTCVRKDTVKGSAKVVAVANALAGQHTFKTVVFDTVTSLQEIIYTELLGLPKVPELMNWGVAPDGLYVQRAEKLRATLSPLVDLKNCNVIFLAQEKDHNAVEDRGGRNKILHTMQQGSFMAPALGATNAQWLQDACGYVIQIYEDEVTEEVLTPQNKPDGSVTQIKMRVGTGKRQRHLRLLYHPNFAAGGRMMYSRDIPEYVTAPDPEGLFSAMSKYIPALR